MSKREKETDMGETGRQKERCTNQRKGGRGSNRELKRERKRHTQADRQRERESRMETEAEE